MSQPERMPAESLVSVTRHRVIQENLRQYIIANRLKPGDPLPPEEILVEQLAVSRSALREALRSMEALGVIATQHGVGRVILPFSFEPILNSLSYGQLFHNQSIYQISEIRKALDAYFIEPAIHNMDEANLETLSTLVAGMERHAQAGEEFEREDYAFHQILYSRCGNQLAYELFEIAWAARRASVNRTLAVEEVPPGTYLEHKALLEAILAGDVELAQRIIIAHHWNNERRFQGANEVETDKDATPEWLQRYAR